MIAVFLLATLLLAPAPAHASTGARTAPAGRAASPAAARKPALPFIEDDFGRALALAKERRLPVFIEGWAPW